MYFSGIKEAYDYQTVEGWWVIMVTYPEPCFAEWMKDFKYDIWCSTVSDYAFTQSPRKQNSDWDYTILIKDPAAYLHFRSRWFSEAEYMICRNSHDLYTAEHHFLECMPDGWKFHDDIPQFEFQS